MPTARALVLGLAVALAACAILAGRSAAEEPVTLEAPKPVRPERAKWWKRARTDAMPASLGTEGVREWARTLCPRLARPPLDGPFVFNGGFGEYRAGHFHAGLDFGTGERVGKPVHAPLSGFIARARTSGVGYGRSLYLQGRDGRLLQFGHLDAFAEPMASWVAAAQESSGQYEQDLYPAAGRFPVKAGDVIAWTGESGAGGPHLHFEVRVGDMAYNPFRAGLFAPEATPPVLTSLTLEPLDEASFVERGAAPYTLRFGSGRDTLMVEGRLRAVVSARDAAGGLARIVPWSVGVEIDGQIVECRFDSLSWATDMPEGDYVFDAGRIVGDKGIVLWAPAGFRPRVMLADAPRDREAGTIVVRPGDPPRRLDVVARDASGGRTARTVVLRAPAAGEAGPDSTRTGGHSTPVSPDDRFEFASLPDGRWRVLFRGAPRGSRGVTIELGGGAVYAASTRGGDWAAVIPRPAWEEPWFLRGRDASGVPWGEEGPRFELGKRDGPVLAPGDPVASGFRWSLPPDARFEPGVVVENLRPVAEPSPPELELVRLAGRLEPEGAALRKPVRILQSLAGVSDASRVGLYRRSRDGWDYLSAKPAEGGTSIEADSRRLGTFALFADTLAPRITLNLPRRKAAAGRYNRWALEAQLAEQGSGVDPRASAFEVDGVRVPSEWDAEERTLRWRPRRAPSAGEHRYTVVATDRAGNVARSTGTFVLD